LGCRQVLALSSKSCCKPVCVELTKMIGARRRRRHQARRDSRQAGAPDERGARKIALSIANSPLVKTAIFGRDPNWGRIAMACGPRRYRVRPVDLQISLGEVDVFRRGEPLDFDAQAAEEVMARDDLQVLVGVGGGPGSATAWTCDFSYGYVEINAEYHT
jgi:glutamate N-acetyltransferase/amino-acid N-acetyltransferase